jgi:hypothetical protein
VLLRRYTVPGGRKRTVVWEGVAGDTLERSASIVAADTQPGASGGRGRAGGASGDGGSRGRGSEGGAAGGVEGGGVRGEGGMGGMGCEGGSGGSGGEDGGVGGGGKNGGDIGDGGGELSLGPQSAQSCYVGCGKDHKLFGTGAVYQQIMGLLLTAP